MAEVEVVKTTFKFRRGTEAAWLKNNPVLASGEPSFVTDKFIFKIGDGVTAWKDLPYPNQDQLNTQSGVFNAQTMAGFPETGKADTIYKAETERKLYQWNSNTQKYESLTNSDIENIEEIKEEIVKIENELQETNQQVSQLIENKVSKNELVQAISSSKYEVFSKPAGTLVNIKDSEIRIMCPKDTVWEKQNPGANANPNNYFIGMKIYAPSDEVHSFKEDMSEIITDQQMYYFENNSFAGIDSNGRKYSIVWLPVALYNEETDSWTYYGEKSSVKRYIGWNYSVEWYDKDENLIYSDCIRINLSNENCHNIIEPYFMSSINVNKLVQDENDYLILYGGSATENIEGGQND